MLIEVVVDSIEDALAAEAGGADRLELVADLPADGLSPTRETVRHVRAATRLPLRVMLRHRRDLAAGTAEERARLREDATAFRDAGADGVVLGFVTDGALDVDAMAAVLERVPSFPATCHRAFEWSGSSGAALGHLARRLPQIDHVMTSGLPGDWTTRVARLDALQKTTPLTVVPAGGIDNEGLAALRAAVAVREVHLGFWVRDGRALTGRVRADYVRAARCAVESAVACR